MARHLHEALAKPAAIAYLGAHVEQLTRNGVFKGHQAARTVFQYLCNHPDENVPGADREATWRCPVEQPHHKPADIAKATGLDVRNVHRALDWLASENLIDVGRKLGGKGKRAAYGPITILSTNWLSDQDRRNEETRRKLAQGHSALNHRVSPAKRHSALNRGTAPLIDDTPTPAPRRRTTAGTRLTWENGSSSETHATLDLAPPARTSAGESPGLDGAPDTRPVGLAGGQDHVEAGPPDTPKATTPSTPRGMDMSSLSYESLGSSSALPGFREARIGGRADLDAARFRLYYDTGDRGHRELVPA